MNCSQLKDYQTLFNIKINTSRHEKWFKIIQKKKPKTVVCRKYRISFYFQILDCGNAEGHDFSANPIFLQQLFLRSLLLKIAHTFK